MHNLRLCGARARKPTFYAPPKSGSPGEWVLLTGCSVGLGFGGVHTRHALHEHILHVLNVVLRTHAITHDTTHTPHANTSGGSRMSMTAQATGMPLGGPSEGLQPS